ncbi:MAG: hypothetical protein EBZ48_06680, partial [Proteobacteria bacterium]|nr:hypothetical protein [Pseudomonadota bacterium]
MFVKAITAILVLCVGSYQPLAFADAPPVDSLSIEQVLDRALHESPMVARIEAAIASIRASDLQNRAPENPSVDSEVRVPNSYRAQRGSNE